VLSSVGEVWKRNAENNKHTYYKYASEWSIVGVEGKRRVGKQLHAVQQRIFVKVEVGMVVRVPDALGSAARANEGVGPGRMRQKRTEVLAVGQWRDGGQPDLGHGLLHDLSQRASHHRIVDHGAVSADVLQFAGRAVAIATPCAILSISPGTP